MAKFKNKNTGVILTTNNKLVTEQLKKNPDYAEVKRKGAGEAKADSAPDAAPEQAENNAEDEGAAE